MYLYYCQHYYFINYSFLFRLNILIRLWYKTTEKKNGFYQLSSQNGCTRGRMILFLFQYFPLFFRIFDSWRVLYETC